MMDTQCRARLLIGGILATVVALLAWAAPVAAHWADLAVAEIAVGERQTDIILTFPTGLLGFADADRDGRLSPEEVRTRRADLEAALDDQIRLTDREKPGALSVEPAGATETLGNARITPETHSTLRLVYRWDRPIQTLVIRYGFFLPGVSTASCVATVLHAGRVQNFVFTPENRELALTVGRQALWAQASGFVLLGIEHILTGYDHLLFLLSLLMLSGGLRYLIKVVSAFTVAHSITLSLAMLDVVTLPTRWVESAIALSIVYVAAENFWRKEQALRDRWLVTFGFGLVHGLGFASILKDLALPRSSLAFSLASFNVGVEIGQVAVVALAFGVLEALRRWPREGQLRRLVSAGAAAMGLVWFIQRAIFFP